MAFPDLPKISTIQERLQLKREPLDKWSTREQLCLAFAVARSGDQNWMSVSRALKAFGEPNRPLDWFHQKNCAAQYNSLLANVETPKRKKRERGVEQGVETPGESILRRLREERLGELKRLMEEEKQEYQKLQEDLKILKAGKISEDQLDKMLKEIDEEESRKEQETINHLKWLKQRELRKQEIERAWKPTPKPFPITPKEELPQPEKPPDVETPKPALSPLLTSLLKSPSQMQNMTPNSILHSAITSPKIDNISGMLTPNQQFDNDDILDEANIKIDDLAKSILVLPEIKKEEVDEVISEMIENIHDIVADPDQHLELDEKGDININLLDDELDPEPESEPEPPKEEPIQPSEPENVDPFEFHEDPVFQSPVKPSSYQSPLKPPSEESSNKPEDMVIEEPAAPPPPTPTPPIEEPEQEQQNEEPEQEMNVPDKQEVVEEVKKEEVEVQKEEEKQEDDVKLESQEVANEDIYDMEVKLDKSKAKRDYSRPKKREDKFDVMLALEKAQLDELDDLKEPRPRLKSETERSSSPWTEEETSKRRLTPVTPLDSLPNSPASVYDEDKDYRNWKKSVMLVYNRLVSHKYSSLFLKPITDDHAPGYSLIIHKPMDLQSIKKHVDNGLIRTSLEFKRSVMLMFTNAIMYNKSNGQIYNMALQMQQESMGPIEILLQAEGQVETPQRRETRTSELYVKRKRVSEDIGKAKKRKED